MNDLHHTEDGITTALNRINAFWPALTTPNLNGNVGSASPSADTINSLDRRISLAHEVMLSLAGWSKIVVEDRHVTNHVPLSTDVPGMIGFLKRHAEWLSWHDAGEDAMNELTTWADKVKLTAFPPKRDWMTIGDCPLTTNDGSSCNGTIRAYTEEGRDPECTNCHIVAVIGWWRPLLTSTLPEYVTAHQLVKHVHLVFGKPHGVNSVRYWVNKGWVTPLPGRPGEALTYHTEASLLRLAQQWDKKDVA